MQYLERYAGVKSPREMAERLHTDSETVEAKLRDLQIDSTGGDRAESELALIATFERGMQALYAERWKEAAEALSLVGESDGPPEVVARARQYAKVASARTGTEKPNDPYLEAVVLKNAGDYPGALALCRKAKRSDGGRFAYLAATVEVLQGNLEAAAAHLEKAYELDARSRGQARHDPDLEDLRESDEFAALFAVGE